MFASIVFLLSVQTTPERTVKSMTLVQIDDELSGIMLSGEGGAIFHWPTHYICGDPQREKHGVDQRTRYSALGREYVALGGRIPSEESFQFIAEASHPSCKPSTEGPEASWLRFSRPIDAMLNRMEVLLRRKRTLLRKTKPE